MLIGYAWVSNAGASLDLQKEVLDRAGVDRLFADVASRSRGRRPQLDHAFSQLRAGDILVVLKLDRLGRSVRHLIATIEYLNRRGIGFRSLKERIDTTTSMGKFMFHSFGRPLADLERDLMREGIETGREKVQACRRRRGTRPKLDETERARVATLYRDPGNSVDDICRRFHIGRRTFYRYVSKDGGRKARSKPETMTGEVAAHSRTPSLPTGLQAASEYAPEPPPWRARR